MNKIFILVLLLFICFSKIYAQKYFPKGAIWHYNVPAWTFPPIVDFTTMESKGDSIFNGDTLTHLVGGANCGAGYDELIKQIGQRIYKLNKCDSTFSLLYDFGAIAGDTLVIYPDICFNNDSIIIKIDSIKPININGNILNHFFISPLYYSYWFFNGDIIEGIGNTYSFYPLLGPCDPWGGPLRCYEDSIIGYYNAGLYASCDTTFSVGIDENETNDNVNIFPNPTTNKIEITANQKIKEIELYDIRGVKLLTTKSRNISLTTLSKGVYFLKLELGNKIIYKKVVKE